MSGNYIADLKQALDSLKTRSGRTVGDSSFHRGLNMSDEFGSYGDGGFGGKFIHHCYLVCVRVRLSRLD